MLEKFLAAVPAQSFTGNGTAGGLITVANSSLFKHGQRVIVAATGQTNQELEIRRVLSATTFTVGPIGGGPNAFSDLSAFTVASGANVFSNEQPRPVVSADDVPRLTYDEEPTVASRMILVDKFGNRIDASNPLPTTASFSGDMNIGKVDQGVPNTSVNAWPVKITDGIDTLDINSDGSIKTKQSSTGSSASVASSTSSVMLLAANTARLGATVYNDSASVLYLKLGTTASSSSFTVKMGSMTYFETPFGYTGRIDGAWATADGFARVGELV